MCSHYIILVAFKGSCQSIRDELFCQQTGTKIIFVKGPGTQYSIVGQITPLPNSRRGVDTKKMAGCFLKYSRTSLKLPPKMRRFRGRLWAVVAYGNQTTWGLSSEKRSPLIYVLFFVCLVQCSRYSELRDQTMCKAVAYKRLKTMENFKTVTPKSGRVRLQEVVVKSPSI